MAPEVTVVIPTHDRPAGLAAALDGLRRQTLGSERFEVVVVDDGSTPPAEAGGDGLDLRVLRHERARGPAAARNAGWRAARAPFVAFTDDDCVPAPGWLEALLAAADERTVVQGSVEPRPDQRHERGPLSRTLDITAINRLYVTASVLYPRAVLEEVRGFDEWYRRPCGEDVDLGARATKAGAGTRFADAAVVHHEVRNPRLTDQIRHALMWRDAVRTVARHPDLRDQLSARVFWKPSHALLLLAVGGMVTRRPSLSLPYVLHLWRLYPTDVREAVRASPAHLAVDAAEIAAVVVGSVQHRTLVL